MICCLPWHCSNSNSTGRVRVSQVVPKSYKWWASAPRRPNTPKMRHLQPCQLLLPCTCNSACSLSFAPTRAETKLLQEQTQPLPTCPPTQDSSKPEPKSLKKSIQHSPNTRADKIHVGIWICETTSCFQLNKFNASSPWRMHVGNWPTEVTANCKDLREQTTTLLRVCRMGILCSPFQFNQISCKASTTCSWHGCPMQMGPLARWPVLPSPSVLPLNKDKSLPLPSR